MILEDVSVRKGLWFVHKRYITTDRQPEICYITKVTPLEVFYRVGSKEGLLTKCSPEYFTKESFLRWATPSQTGGET